jgi:hypothetical protein
MHNSAFLDTANLHLNMLVLQCSQQCVRIFFLYQIPADNSMDIPDGEISKDLLSQTGHVYSLGLK